MVLGSNKIVTNINIPHRPTISETAPGVTFCLPKPTNNAFMSMLGSIKAHKRDDD